jgi:hypothetical protein
MEAGRLQFRRLRLCPLTPQDLTGRAQPALPAPGAVRDQREPAQRPQPPPARDHTGAAGPPTAGTRPTAGTAPGQRPSGVRGPSLSPARPSGQHCGILAPPPGGRQAHKSMTAAPLLSHTRTGAPRGEPTSHGRGHRAARRRRIASRYKPWHKRSTLDNLLAPVTSFTAPVTPPQSQCRGCPGPAVPAAAASASGPPPGGRPLCWTRPGRCRAGPGRDDRGEDDRGESVGR